MVCLLQNIVDLAGSERVALTGATGERLIEAEKINLSNFKLTSVVAQLNEWAM